MRFLTLLLSIFALAVSGSLAGSTMPPDYRDGETSENN